jgi:hypothetical protein
LAPTVERELGKRPSAQRFPGGLLTRKRSQVQTLSRPPLFSQVTAPSGPSRARSLLAGPRWGRTPSAPSTSLALPGPSTGPSGSTTTTERGHAPGKVPATPRGRQRPATLTPSWPPRRPAVEHGRSLCPSPTRPGPRPPLPHRPTTTASPPPGRLGPSTKPLGTRRPPATRSVPAARLPAPRRDPHGHRRAATDEKGTGRTDTSRPDGWTPDDGTS